MAYIDSLNMAWVDFFDALILVGLTDDLFNIFVLSSLFFNFLPQSGHLWFKLFPRRFMVLAAHIKALVIRLALGFIFIYLVYFQKTIKTMSDLDHSGQFIVPLMNKKNCAAETKCEGTFSVSSHSAHIFMYSMI